MSEELFDINKFPSFGKTADVLIYLTNLHNALSQLDQDPKSAPMLWKKISDYLLNSKTLQSTNKEIRLLDACCLVDILRIFAPTAPFDDSDMLRVMDFLANQIRGLQTADINTTIGKRIYYIMNSLSSVKSCVVPVILSQSGVSGSDDTTQSLLQAIVTSVRSDHSEQILICAANILQCCIEEFDAIPFYVLNILLQPLLPACKLDNPTAYKLAAHVVKSTAPLLQSSLTKFVESILIGSSNDVEGEIVEDIYPLIFELHNVSPKLLNNILPIVLVQLKVEEQEIRHKAVKLLGKLFSSDKAEYIKDHPRDFKDFIARFNDLSPEIRLTMVDFSVVLLDRESCVEDLVVKRLRDPVEEIRLRAVQVLLRFAETNLSRLSIASLQEVGERGKDKKLEIRREAVSGLAKLYYSYISSKLPPLSDETTETISSSIQESVSSRLNFVPSLILKCWGYPEAIFKHMVIQLLQEQILPRRVEDGSNLSKVRAAAMVLLFSFIETTDRSFLKAIFSFKARVRDEISKTTDLKKSQLDKKEEKSVVEDMKKSLCNMIHLVSLPEKRLVVFDKFVSSRDRAVLKLLTNCSSCAVSILDGIKHKEDLQSRFDSKSELGEYLGMICDYGGCFWLNKDMFDSLMKWQLHHLNDKKHSNVGAEIISLLCRYNPKLCSHHGRNLSMWLQSCLAKGKVDKLRVANKSSLFEYFSVIVSDCGRLLLENDKVSLVSEIINIHRKSDSADECEKLGKALMYIAFDGTETSEKSLTIIDDYVQSLCSSSLSLSNPRILQNLVFLATLFTIPRAAYGSIDSVRSIIQSELHIFSSIQESVLEFLRDTVLEASCTDDSVPVDVVQISLEVLARFLCLREESKQIEGHSEEPADSVDSDQHFKSFVDKLFEVIESKGARLGTITFKAAADQRSLFQTTVECLVLMMKLNSFGTIISIENWRQIANCFLHGESVFRKKMVDSFTEIIHTHPLNMKFLACVCLLCVDSATLEQSVHALTFAIKRLRKTQEELSSKMQTELNDSEKLSVKKVAAKSIPELILPYLLYLLSYEPWFPSDLNIDSTRAKNVFICIQNLLKCFQETLHDETSNFPFLFKMLNTLLTQCRDRADVKNNRLHILAVFVIKILQDKVKSSNHVQNYPGSISLPKDLFIIRSSDSEDKIDMDEVEDNAQKLYQATVKGKNKNFTTSPSPTKIKMSLSSLQEPPRKNSDAVSKSFGSTKVAPSAAIPTRVLPGRSAKNSSVSYLVPEEDESEVEKWDSVGLSNDEAELFGKINVGSQRKRSLSEERVENPLKSPPKKRK